MELNKTNQQIIVNMVKSLAEFRKMNDGLSASIQDAIRTELGQHGVEIGNIEEITQLDQSLEDSFKSMNSPRRSAKKEKEVFENLKSVVSGHFLFPTEVTEKHLMRAFKKLVKHSNTVSTLEDKHLLFDLLGYFYDSTMYINLDLDYWDAERVIQEIAIFKKGQTTHCLYSINVIPGQPQSDEKFEYYIDGKLIGWQYPDKSEGSNMVLVKKITEYFEKLSKHKSANKKAINVETW